MKKLLSFIVGIMLLLSAQGFAAGIEVQPTMLSRSNEQDRVWVGTFQIVWNEFIDKYVHGPVRFREGTPAYVHELNKQDFTTNDLNSSCYYKYSGKVTKKTSKTIKKAIKKKFNETSDILDSLDLTPNPKNFLIYAMLKKDFEFLNEFDRLGRSSFGKAQTAEYFGIDKNSDTDLRNGIEVLFYNNPDDFAVVIPTKDNDEVYFYKNGANKEFRSLYKEMRFKALRYQEEKSLQNIDELKIPDIKFDITKTFDDLCGKRVMGTNLVISGAIETVKFDMNNKGVKLKSEAALTLATSALMPEEIKPRYFFFDSTFVIFLKEKGKKNPYFALRVNDITKFQ